MKKALLRKMGKVLIALFVISGLWVGVESTVPVGDADTVYAAESKDKSIRLSDIPDYDGKASVEIHKNEPFFSKSEMTDSSYLKLKPLDSNGRCGAAEACLGKDTLATKERGEIGEIKPSGWQTVKYDGIDGNYLYNRCHLLGYALSGENANEKNLITGTRYLNTAGMQPFEEKTLEYIEQTGNHVIYRVTPVYEGDELVARGVLMEAKSVEDDGKGICFCAFCYNVQPGITIDYTTGESQKEEVSEKQVEEQKTETSESKEEDKKSDDTEIEKQSTQAVLESSDNGSGSQAISESQPAVPQADAQQYILNTNTKKFHIPGCGSVAKMKEKNKQVFYGTREEAIAAGYDPCGNCHP